MFYAYAKALHIIFVVCWFAALFYMPRLLVYYRQEQGRAETTALLYTMMRRLWFGISVPAALLTLCSGLYLFFHQPFIAPWLWLKLGFLSLLYAFHFWLQSTFLRAPKQLAFSPRSLRWINEIPSLLLFGIVFAVVAKTILPTLFAVGGVFVAIGLAFVGIAYRKKKSRTKQ